MRNEKGIHRPKSLVMFMGNQQCRYCRAIRGQVKSQHSDIIERKKETLDHAGLWRLEGGKEEEQRAREGKDDVISTAGYQVGSQERGLKSSRGAGGIRAPGSCQEKKVERHFWKTRAVTKEPSVDQAVLV
jgi:hypothetical protein